MPSKIRSLALALATAAVALLALLINTNTPTKLAAPPSPQASPPVLTSQTQIRPTSTHHTVQVPPPSTHTVRLVNALDRGYPLKLTVDGHAPLTFVTTPRHLLTPGFKLTLGLDTSLELHTPPRISDARSISPTGTLTATRASITVVGDAVTAIIEHASGDVTAIKTHPETGQLHTLEIPAGHLVAACHHDFAAGIATATSDTPLPTDAEWLAGPLAQLEPDIANAGGIDPGTGRLDKYVQPIPLGQNYDRSLADMVMTIVLDKDATGSASTNNLTNKASEYLARMANVAAVHEHQLGIKTIIGELLLTPDTDDYTDVPASLGNFRSWVSSNRARGTYRWNACAKFGQTGTSGGTIGVAYVSALSGGNGVSVNNKGFTHALVAHETGHNMGSGHSSGGIMNPSIVSGSRTFFNDVSAGETAAKDIYDHTRSRIYGDATMRHPEQIPFANDDDRTTAADTEHRFDPTANDDRTVRNGTANTTLTVEETSRVNPLHAGSVAVEANEIVFTPSPDYQGLAHFSYSLRGDVGNGGQGWLHKGDVGMQVGSFNSNSLNLTLAPGQHFSFRPSGSANPS
ncbi:MAG: M12 family metallo-peptidase, partial [Verrucomicrobiales bacterium]|nr:M12 family metallo-peptidase [Verrucomicrobiales bacterium]